MQTTTLLIKTDTVTGNAKEMRHSSSQHAVSESVQSCRVSVSSDHFTFLCITARRTQRRWSPQPPHTHLAFVALYISLFLSPPSPVFIITVMSGLARNFMAIYNCLKQVVGNWTMSKRNLHLFVPNPYLSSHPLKSPEPLTTPQP
jgi:hypothetical protein